jgi:hypothetical protein
LNPERSSTSYSILFGASKPDIFRFIRVRDRLIFI